MWKTELRKLRRKIFESFGSPRYSRPSLYEIDRKLERYLPYHNGFFIEAGANDGFRQSNTYYLERFKGWQGILVEGIPQLYQKCVTQRLKSQVFNCALVGDDFTESTVTMKYANLMSIVDGALKNEACDRQHLARAIEYQHDVDRAYDVIVPARTLTSVLDEAGVGEIDLLSLDVEGFELNVLKGLNFNKYQPKYMLIEARFKSEIDRYLSELYIEVEQLSFHDYLYQSRQSL